MPLSANPHASPYFVLFEKAKRLHWDPADIDLATDRAQWARIRADHGPERYAEQIHRLCAHFASGEESVTNTLAPFLAAVPRGGLGLDKEFHLAAQLYEEAKHYDFFARYYAEVFEEDPASAPMELAPASRAILLDGLEEVTERLRVAAGRDAIRAAFVESVAYYMGCVEAMLARTGYVAAHEALHDRGWLPGLQEGFRLIRRDEGRHVSFGIHVVREMCADAPALRDVVRATFDRALPNVLGTIQDFAQYETPIVDLQKLTGFALRAFEQFLGAAGIGTTDARDFEQELDT